MLLERARHGSKLKYMLSRIFLPYDSLKKIYPILNKRRILTPIYEVFRWFTFVFRDSKSRKYGELSASKESLDDLSLIIDNLGI